MITYGLLRPDVAYSQPYKQVYNAPHVITYQPALDQPTRITKPSRWAQRTVTEEEGADDMKQRLKREAYHRGFGNLDRQTQAASQKSALFGGFGLNKQPGPGYAPTIYGNVMSSEDAVTSKDKIITGAGKPVKTEDGPQYGDSSNTGMIIETLMQQRVDEILGLQDELYSLETQFNESNLRANQLLNQWNYHVGRGEHNQEVRTQLDAARNHIEMLRGKVKHTKRKLNRLRSSSLRRHPTMIEQLVMGQRMYGN